MNSRERIDLVLNHKEPDRVPRSSFFSVLIKNIFKKIFNVNNDFEVSNVFDNDFLIVFTGFPSPWLVNDSNKIRKEGEIFIDEWGIEYKIVYRNGYYPTIVKNPLSDIKNYSNYKFPDPLKDSLNYNILSDVINKYKKERFIFGGDVSTLFEGAWFLRGMENFLTDLYLNPDFVEDLLDKLADYKIKAGIKNIELGADIVWLGDDVGMQDRMLIPPEMFRKFLKNRYAKIISEIKKVKKDVKIAFHTCGYIEPIVPDFIEIGVDILNSLQPVNNLEMIKKTYGKEICFWGGIDVQEVLPVGDPENIINEVKEKLKILAPQGGYMISPSNEIEYSDKVINNIFVYYWALDRYGRYPLSI